MINFVSLDTTFLDVQSAISLLVPVVITVSQVILP